MPWANPTFDRFLPASTAIFGSRQGFATLLETTIILLEPGTYHAVANLEFKQRTFLGTVVHSLKKKSTKQCALQERERREKRKEWKKAQEILQCHAKHSPQANIEVRWASSVPNPAAHFSRCFWLCLSPMPGF
jgi:hypothetical protein